MIKFLFIEPVFFDSGGFNQPGCDDNKLKIGCSHIRSHQLFTESIFSKCPFTSISCESYEAFKKGKCSHCNGDGRLCIRFGFHSRSSYKSLFENGVYESSPIATYLFTSDKRPYCSAHYRMTVKVSGKFRCS